VNTNKSSLQLESGNADSRERFDNFNKLRAMHLYNVNEGGDQPPVASTYHAVRVETRQSLNLCSTTCDHGTEVNNVICVHYEGVDISSREVDAIARETYI